MSCVSQAQYRPSLWIEEMLQPVRGQPIRRREDLNLLQGRGRFVADVPLTNALHAVFVRSNCASGEIVALDTADARHMPGVRAVFTGADVKLLGKLPVNPVLDTVRVPDYPILATDRVCAVGQPLVAILAESPTAGADAAETVMTTIDETPPLLPADHLAMDVHGSETDPNNTLLIQRWSQGNTAEAFANQNYHVVEATVSHPRLAPSPLEPRAIAVEYIADSDCVTVWLTTQTPHRSRTHLADILAIDPKRLRLIAPDVGGAFGMKASLYPEDIFVVWAALKLKRAVRWTATRNEDLLAATHGRGTHTRGALAFTDDGEFVALNAAIVCPLGHWLPHSGAIPAWNAARILPGPYRIDSVDISTRGVFTNTAPVGIYRGAGRPEAAMLMELLVDRAAAIADLATEEIRRRNLLTFNELPRTGPTGIRLDSGDYPAALAKLCELADISGLRRIRRARRQAGELVGIGVAFFIEPCGAGWESARVTYRNGSVTAAVGTSSQGQGRETAYAQILADIFSVAMHQVDVVHGDTGTCPAGIGALASRSTAIGASAVYQAALQVKNKLTDNLEPRESIEANVVYTADNEAWGYGCYLAVVSIDRETGSPCVEKMACLDDAGTVINPLLSEGQIVGGIAQGIGESLLEKIVYDADGQLLTGSLLDYALPRATDMPDIIIGEMETAADGNALGAKGIGEAGSIGAPAAVVNAVADALTEYGIPEVRMPLTAEAIWQFMKTASDGT